MFVAVFLADFALQAVLRHAAQAGRDHPVALIAEKTSHARILQCNDSAQNAGVLIGMTPTQAHARCGSLRVMVRSADAERCARAALLDCAGAFSPYVEDTAEGICTLELKGLGALIPAACAEDIITRLVRLNLQARVGFAANADLALLAAQSTDSWREVREARELWELPLQYLHPPAVMLDVLHRWGIETIGEFVQLGREHLVERLGTEILPLFARASGKVDRPLHCIPPRETFEEGVEFEFEIETLEPLLFMLRRFLEQIALRLESSYLVAAELMLRLGFANRSFHERTFKIPAPTAKVDVLFRTIHTHLERYTAEQPIVGMHLIARPCRPARQQYALFESALRDPNQFFETLARLIALLGEGRVGIPEPQNTHRPDAFQLKPIDMDVPAPFFSRATLSVGLCLRRFRPPVSAIVVAEEDRLLSISTPVLSGDVLASQGPVRLSGDWWNAQQRWSRCEWDVELIDGTLCRLFRECDAWFLDGIYD